MPDRGAFRRRTLALVLLTALGASPCFAQASLARARDLYQTADYEQSLAMLDQLHGDTPSELTEIGTYKVFCLVALGRSDDAARAIDAIVSIDPFYQPAEAVASPRVRAVFRDARRAALPAVAQREYAAAKTAFDKKDRAATGLFERVLRLLDDPDLKTPASADLRTLAEGFRDLSRAFSAQAQATPPTPPTDVVLQRGSEGAPAPAAVRPQPPAAAVRETAASPAPPAPIVVSAPPVASQQDANVTPPVALAQPLPRWTPPSGAASRMQQYEGVLQVFIDPRGSVTDVRLQASVQPQYDAELLKMARTWKFKPAMRDGAPVPYVKVVQVRLAPPAR